MTDSGFLSPPVLLCGQNLAEPRKVELKAGQAVVFSRPQGGQSGANEDALGIVETRDGGVCRAFFKLKEAWLRAGFPLPLPPGAVALDLGAAPGG